MGTKVSALTEATALTDADELYVNDGGTSKRATVATLKDTVGITAAVDNTRLSAGVRNLALSPSQKSTTPFNAGDYRLVLAEVPAQTPSTVSVEITATAASSNLYVVVYAPDPTDGLPGVLAVEWGPFDVSAGTDISLTSQVEVLAAAGWYWVGGFAPTANSNAPTMRTFDKLFTGGGTLFGGTAANETLGVLKISSGDETPSADLSAVTGWTSASSGTKQLFVTVA